ncbi:MAG: TonB-dependent receptor plug domain-containing protein, partial [Verrucomicrobiota bacterium]
MISLRSSRLLSFVIAGFLTVPLVSSAQTKPATSSPAANGATDVVDLSPFVVSADSVNGYTASQTLSGTRLRSEARDVGTAMTILTPEFLDDIGATDITSAFDFVPSTETYRLSATDTDGNSSRSGNTYTVRGFQSSSLSLNFFTTNVRIDRYNTESFSFNRGPNSILFGAGSPGGLIDAATKQANFRGNRTHLEVRLSDVGPGSKRFTFDQNFGFKAKRFAVRVAGVYQDGSTPQTPSRDDRRALFLTATKQLFSDTTVRVNAERGTTDRLPGRQYVVYDRYTPWVKAGKPLVTGTRAPLDRTGLVATGANYLVKVEGTDLPVMNWGGLWRGANPTVAGTARTDISFGDESILPYETNVGGPKDLVHYDYQTYSAFIEQRIGDKLAIEIAAQYEPVKRDELITSRGLDYSILADASATLPDGSPNPYAGMPFIENGNSPLPSDQTFENRQARITASYELDLRSKGGKWLNLGRYQLAGMASTSWEEMTYMNYAELNLVGNPLISNAANRIHRRTYLLPGGPQHYNPSYNVIQQAAGATPAITPAVSSGWRRVAAARHTYEKIASLMFVGQAHYLDDRLVITYGVRQDKSNIKAENYTAAADGTYSPWDQGGRWVAPVYATAPTRTLGGVAHLTKNFSVYYNTSDNFEPPGGNTINVWQEIVPPAKGTGYDAGLKVSLFGGRLLGSVGYFETTKENEGNSTLTSQGNKSAVIASLWEATDPSKAPGRNDWVGLRDIAAHGMEAQFVFTPTPSWRISVSGSRNITKSSNLVPELIAYIATHRPVWEANLNRPAVSNFGTTVGQVLASLDNSMALTLAETGRQALGQREWSANLVTDYRFSKLTFLEGWNVGASGRWRGSYGFFQDIFTCP